MKRISLKPISLVKPIFLSKFLSKQIFLIFLFGLFLLLTACSVPENKVCSTDRDCVPDACCHAAGTINKENAPDCSGMLCTMECAPDTLDCGQGEMKCINSGCQVVWKE